MCNKLHLFVLIFAYLQNNMFLCSAKKIIKQLVINKKVKSYVRN